MGDYASTQRPSDPGPRRLPPVALDAQSVLSTPRAGIVQAGSVQAVSFWPGTAAARQQTRPPGRTAAAREPPSHKPYQAHKALGARLTLTGELADGKSHAVGEMPQRPGAGGRAAPGGGAGRSCEGRSGGRRGGVGWDTSERGAEERRRAAATRPRPGPARAVPGCLEGVSALSGDRLWGVSEGEGGPLGRAHQRPT